MKCLCRMGGKDPYSRFKYKLDVEFRNCTDSASSKNRELSTDERKKISREVLRYVKPFYVGPGGVDQVKVAVNGFDDGSINLLIDDKDTAIKVSNELEDVIEKTANGYIPLVPKFIEEKK